MTIIPQQIILPKFIFHTEFFFTLFYIFILLLNTVPTGRLLAFVSV